MKSTSEQKKSLGNDAAGAPGSSVPFKLFMALSILVGGASLLAGLAAIPAEGARGWLYLTALAALTSALGVRLPIRIKNAGCFAATLADCFTILALVLFGWKAAVLATAADGLAASLRFGPRKPMRMAFNICQMCLTTFLTAQLFWSLHGGNHPLEFSWSRLGTTLALLLVAILFSFSFNGAMVSTAIGLYSGANPGELIRGYLVKLSPTSLAALAATVALWSPLPRPAAFPLALGLLALGWFYSRWLRSKLAV